ncbi:MAG TPA: hypothetical protein VFV52_06715 [Bacilli bacterium]|nr:hypothetical protein [Bacilli bacterium]
MVFEERYGERVTCPHCEAKLSKFEEIPVQAEDLEQARWQEQNCHRCEEAMLFKRVNDFGEATSLWLADANGEPLRRYVIFPEANGRRVLWRMFVEDPLHTFLARQGYYDRHLQRVGLGTGKRLLAADRKREEERENPLRLVRG